MRNEVNKNIIYPVIVSFLITATIISFLVFAIDNQHLEKIKGQAFDFSILNLRDIGQAVGISFKNYLNNVINDVYSLNLIVTASYQHDITLSTTINPTSKSDFYANALNLAIDGPQNTANTIPGFESTTGVSLFRPMWYINRDITDIASASEFQPYYENFISSLPLTYGMYSSGQYSQIFSINHKKDSSDNKNLFSAYPLTKDFSTFAKNLVKGYWWTYANQISEKSGEAFFLSPYYLSSIGYVYCACIPNLLNSDTLVDKTTNCINYQMKYLQDQLQKVTKSKSLTYFIIDRLNFNVILHSNLTGVFLEGSSINITQVEFDGLPETEAYNYTAKLKSLSSSLSSTNYYMQYTKNGETQVVAFTEVQITTGSTTSASFLIGVVQSQSSVYNLFESFHDNILNHAKIQVIATLVIILLFFICFFILSGRIENYMSVPIKDLTILGKNFLEFWNADNQSYALSAEELLISLSLGNNAAGPNNFGSFNEAQNAFNNFSKLITIVRYIKEAQNASTDPEALMNYSQALKIYEELNNTQGLSVTYSSIANLHQRSQRYEEASTNYKKSIEKTRQELEKLKESINQRAVEKISSKRRRFRRNLLPHQTEEDDYEIKNNLVEMEDNFKLDLSLRLYEYGKCLIKLKEKARSYDKSILSEEIKTTFAEVIRNDKELRSMSNRLIISLLVVLNITIEQGDSDMIRLKLQEIELILKEYKETFENKISLENKTQTIPPSIFRQNFMFQKALYFRKIGQKREACRILVDIIESEAIYDPHVRRKSLTELKNILESQKLSDKASIVQDLLKSYTNKSKDIMILLDCSQSMSQGARMRLMVSNMLKFFDNYLKPTDRVGYITFNVNCDVIFQLTEKRKNTNQIRRLLEAMPRPAGGTALFAAIHESLKIIEKAEPRNSAKWVVALVDGDDNDHENRISFQQIFRKLSRSDVNLIVLGLALGEHPISKFTELTRATREGLFIDSPSEDKITEGFNMISSIIYGEGFEFEDMAFELK